MLTKTCVCEGCPPHWLPDQRFRASIRCARSVTGIGRPVAMHGIQLTDIDLGGGFGVTYENEAPFDVDAWGATVTERLAHRGLTVSVEPGRFLTANAGVLLSRVEYLKPANGTTTDGVDADEAGKNFAIMDAAMNDLLRPSLYQAWHGY